MLHLQSISKSFGPSHILNDVSLDVAEGEFFSLLGPSGCGKTTLLRIIGGQEFADSGRVILLDRDITSLPPPTRPLHMIFQRLALFPHLTVGGNISFGLRLKRLPVSEIERRVRDVLQLVDLADFQHRPIATLSGGQQQRVAIARAIVTEPKLLLLDEPLSALDLKLRQKMQIELRALQQKLGTSFIFVTHAQDEALSLSDRIAVMNRGRIEQVGRPQDIYNRPETPFVAGFIGAANFFTGFCSDQERVEVRLDAVSVGGAATPGKWRARNGEAATVIVRPEHVVLSSTSPGIAAVVERTIFRGGYSEVLCRTRMEGSASLVSCHIEREVPAVGAQVSLSWAPDCAVVMAGHHNHD